MGFDPIDIQQAANKVMRKLTESGQIGSGEAKKTYTFDGNIEDKVVVPYTETADGYAYFVKVSDDMPDLNKFERCVGINGTFLPTNSDIYISEGTVENGYLFGAKGYILVLDNQPEVAVITDVLESGIPETGLYFAYCYIAEVSGIFYPSELVISGTLKTIDPKYLPGLTLPVVELSEETATALVGVGGATLTTDEAAIFDKMASDYTPFLITAKVQGMVAINGLMQYGVDIEYGTVKYMGVLPHAVPADEGTTVAASLSVFNFEKTADGWIATFRIASIPA